MKQVISLKSGSSVARSLTPAESTQRAQDEAQAEAEKTAAMAEENARMAREKAIEALLAQEGDKPLSPKDVKDYAQLRRRGQ